MDFKTFVIKFEIKNQQKQKQKYFKTLFELKMLFLNIKKTKIVCIFFNQEKNGHFDHFFVNELKKQIFSFKNFTLVYPNVKIEHLFFC